MCPAAMGKIRCPLRPASMTLTRDRPEILTPPEHPPACCTQQTITVPPDVPPRPRRNTTTPPTAHRKSYARRTGAERTFSTAKDPASNNIARGWTRLMGLAPLMLWLACLLTVRNQRILTAWDARQDDDARRAAAGPPPRPAAGAARPSPTWPQRATTITRPPNPHQYRHHRSPDTQTSRPCPETARNRHPATTQPPEPAHSSQPAKMSDPNVKISAGQT